MFLKYCIGPSMTNSPGLLGSLCILPNLMCGHVFSDLSTIFECASLLNSTRSLGPTCQMLQYCRFHLSRAKKKKRPGQLRRIYLCIFPLNSHENGDCRCWQQLEKSNIQSNRRNEHPREHISIRFVAITNAALYTLKFAFDNLGKVFCGGRQSATMFGLWSAYTSPRGVHCTCSTLPSWY